MNPAIEAYLMDKITYIHTEIFTKNIFDVKGNEEIEKQTERSTGFFLRFLQNLKPFKTLSTFPSQLCVAEIFVILYKICGAANCQAYKSMLLLLLTSCEKNYILSGYTLGYFMCKRKENDHTFLILYNKQQKIEYIIDPTFKVVKYISDDREINDFIETVFKDHRTLSASEGPDELLFKHNKYVTFPLIQSKETKDIIENILMECAKKVDDFDGTDKFKADFKKFVDLRKK